MRATVLTSGIWQTSSTILSHGDACIVVDPAYFPRELDAIADEVRAIGRVTAVAFTHGHWDHVMGHARFDAPVWLGRKLDDAIARNDARVARYLEDARDFDSRWYVPRDGYAWPANRRSYGEGDRIDIGSPIRVLELAGHSFDGIALVIEELGLLLPGDHLSPCEIPFVEDAHAYRATLVRLIELLGELREVIPGHGARMPASAARELARADLEYVDRLLDVRDAAAAAAIVLPRAADVVGMRDHHRDNCKRLGVTFA